MTSLDILFWLLVVLLAGVAWAIEAGLGSRHRSVLAAGTISTLGSMIFIMFWIDDHSKLQLGERPVIERGKGGPDRGQFEFKDAGKDKAKKDAAPSAPGGKEKEKPVYEDDGNIEYSRIPFKDCRHCPDMVIVPAGTFNYGSATDDPLRGSDEREQILGTVPQPFAIGRVEVTRAEFAAFIAASGHQPAATCEVQVKRRGVFNWKSPGFEQDDRHPVVCVNWHDANAYTNWLSRTTGRSYRLPTELEWEYMAAGSRTPIESSATPMRLQANFARTRDGTIVGGSLTANGFGLSDTLGNAWEMLGDCSTDPATRPQDGKQSAPGDDSCTERFLKGGAWNSPPNLTRIPARAKIGIEQAVSTIGFRVARSVDEQDAGKILSAEAKAAIAAANKADAEIREKAKNDAEKAETARLKEEADEKADAEAKLKAKADRDKDRKKKKASGDGH